MTARLGPANTPQTCVFKLRWEADQIPKYTETLIFVVSSCQRVCFYSYTELMLSLWTPLTFSLFCNKAGIKMNMVESV